uniref:Replication protein n=1 Tax=viral metagenome TaxID=1070528 RepID=A0A6H1ZWQ9_9ZZZZ
MYNGYVKLWRKIINSSVFADPNLLKLWVLCLLKASYKNYFISVDGIIDPVELKPGQFLTGRYALHKEFYGKKKKVKSPLTVWRWLELLEKCENLNIKSYNKYSIITINNWKQYQQDEQQMNNRRTTDEQQMNTNKKDKKEKNIETDFKFEKLVPIPKDIFLTNRMKEYVQKQGCDDLNHAEQLFEDFCINHKKRGTKWKDWTSAFYTWVRNDKKIYHPNYYKQKEYI